MKQKRYLIIGEFNGQKVTLKTVNDAAEAERTRNEFARCFSSSWIIKIEIKER